MILGAGLAVAGNVKQSRLNLGPGAVLTVVNGGGSVSLHPGNDRQVVVSATTYSDKVEADIHATPDGRRGEVITHVLSQQRLSADESKVDYDITVPSGISVIVNTATAPITVDSVTGDITVASDTGQITVRRVSQSHLHVRGVAAPVEMSEVNNTYVDITSAGGPVRLTQVTGPTVEVRTTSGSITYKGDFASGHYKFSTHDAPIDVSLPEFASVDLDARSTTGSVDSSAFPFEKKDHPTYTPPPGRAFAGTSHSGLSSVELRSYSGRIRVKKQ
jgi:hypothetical protein